MSSSDYTTQLKLRQIDRRLTTQINNDHYHDCNVMNSCSDLQIGLQGCHGEKGDTGEKGETGPAGSSPFVTDNFNNISYIDGDINTNNININNSLKTEQIIIPDDILLVSRRNPCKQPSLFMNTSVDNTRFFYDPNYTNLSFDIGNETKFIINKNNSTYITYNFTGIK